MSDTPPAGVEPEQTFYEMAYFALPEYVFRQPEKLLKELSAGRIGAAFFYVLTCKMGQKEPDPGVAHEFDVHAGRLDDRRDYYVIQYPPPRLVEMPDLPPEQLIEAMSRVVLAPYFSAVVVERESKELRYFTLGQSPDGRTTLRGITPEFNANLGAGSEPALEPFLQLLRKGCAAGFQAVAGVGRSPPPENRQDGRKRWWQFWK